MHDYINTYKYNIEIKDNTFANTTMKRTSFNDVSVNFTNKPNKTTHDKTKPMYGTMLTIDDAKAANAK